MVRFRLKLKSTGVVHRLHHGFYSSPLQWEEVSSLVKTTFDLHPDARILLRGHDGGETITVNQQSDMPWLEEHLVVCEREHGLATMEVDFDTNSAVEKAPSNNVVVRVGVGALQRLIHLPSDCVPSLITVEETAFRLFEEKRGECLHFDAGEGNWIEMRKQEDWETVGWPAAVQAHRASQVNGGWAAVFFHVGLPSHLRNLSAKHSSSSPSSAFETESLRSLDHFSLDDLHRSSHL